MSAPRLIVLAALVAGVGLASTATARHHNNRYGDERRWQSEYDNRRDARRAGIVAGAIRADVARANTEYRYQECMRNSGYDYDCEQRRYYDEQHAQNAGRRAAVIVAAERR